MSARTLRSTRQRMLVFQESGGVCPECGCEITPETMELDHVVPWHAVRETTLDNMRALCGPCNRAKGARVNTTSALERFQAMVAHAESHGMYTHQVRAIQTIGRRYVEGEDVTRIIMPVRTGKSDVVTVGALCLKESGLAPACLAATVGDALADQLISRDETDDRVARYGWPRLTNTGRIVQQRQIYDANGEYLVVTNQQWLIHNIDHIVSWIREKRQRTGAKPVVFIDETHMCSNRNRWGEHIDALIEAGAHVVMLTGTPWRQGGEVLKQWPYEWESTTPAERYKVQSVPGDPEHLRVSRLEGAESVGKVLNDYEFPLKDAWDNKFLCHVNDVPIDWHVEVNGEEMMLSQCPGKIGRTATRKAIDEDLFVERFASEFVECLWLARERNSRAQAIGYGGNDEQNDAEENRRLRQFQAAILKKDPSLKVVIATMKSSEAITQTLDRFRGSRDKKYTDGHGDVLLLKQAGGTGFNAPAVKVIGDLSTVRSLSPTMQRWFRGGTPWGGFGTFWLVRPADESATAIYEVFVSSNGGDAKSFEGDVVEEWLTEKSEATDPDEVSVGEQGHASIGDSYGRGGDEADLTEAKILLAGFPELQEHYTALGALERFRAGRAVFERSRELSGPASQAANGHGDPMPGERKRKLDAEIRDNLKLVVECEIELRGGRGSVDYGVVVREAWGIAYSLAGIHPDPHVKSSSVLQSITDIVALERLRDVTREMREHGIYHVV